MPNKCELLWSFCKNSHIIIMTSKKHIQIHIQKLSIHLNCTAFRSFCSVKYVADWVVLDEKQQQQGNDKRKSTLRTSRLRSDGSVRRSVMRVPWGSMPVPLFTSLSRLPQTSHTVAMITTCLKNGMSAYKYSTWFIIYNTHSGHTQHNNTDCVNLKC